MIRMALPGIAPLTGASAMPVRDEPEWAGKTPRGSVVGELSCQW
jgi:hypothetical protein